MTRKLNDFSKQRLYKVLYQVTHKPEGVKGNDVPIGMGAADAIFMASILYPEDGTLSMLFLSKDGRTGEELDDHEWFKVWMLLAPRLAASERLDAGKRALCAEVHGIIADAILRRDEKPKLGLVAVETESCAVCSMDPALPENRGAQIYVCDACGKKVCSSCSENEDTGGQLLCLAYAAQRPCVDCGLTKDVHADAGGSKGLVGCKEYR